jgi:hypothetical protein
MHARVPLDRGARVRRARAALAAASEPLRRGVSPSDEPRERLDADEVAVAVVPLLPARLLARLRDAGVHERVERVAVEPGERDLAAAPRAAEGVVDGVQVA